MKHCPNLECPHGLAAGRAAEYRDDVLVCADCGASLEDDEPPEIPILHDMPHLTTIAQYVSPAEAHIDRSRLESVGIPAFVFGDTLIGFEMMIEGGSIQLQVPQGRAEQAMHMLTSARLHGPATESDASAEEPDWGDEEIDIEGPDWRDEEEASGWRDERKAAGWRGEKEAAGWRGEREAAGWRDEKVVVERNSRSNEPGTSRAATPGSGTSRAATPGSGSREANTPVFNPLETERCRKCGGEMEPARKLFGFRLKSARCRFCAP